MKKISKDIRRKIIAFVLLVICSFWTPFYYLITRENNGCPNWLIVLYFVLAVVVSVMFFKLLFLMERKEKETKEPSNLKRFLVALIPFAFLILKTAKIMFGPKGYDKKWEEYSKYEHKIRWMNIWWSLIFIFIWLFFIMYIYDVVSYKTFNFTNFSEIRSKNYKQHQSERLIFEQNVTEKVFTQLAGADSVISKTEFKNFLEQNTSDKYNDLYSEFNNWLELEEEYIDPVYRKKK